MWLIAGLGNPGNEYAATRHNIGFMAIDALAHKAGVSSFTKKFHGDVAQATWAGQKCLLLKPQTYMNASGRSVQAAAAFYKIPPEKILVLHDDLDLPLGKLRIKQGGGHGGHNGLRDIDAALGQQYWRWRLGIGHPGDKARVHGHVLSAFTSHEKVQIEDFLAQLVLHGPLFFSHSPEALMSKVTATPHPQKP